MIRYMLDTDIISDLIKNPQGSAAKRIAKLGEANICTSIIVAAELRYGCAKSGSKRLLKAVEDLLSEINVLPFEVPADTEYGRIRAELEAAGKPIGSNDLLSRQQRRSGGLRLVYGLDSIENLAEIALRDLNVIVVLQIEPKLCRCAECLGEPKSSIGGNAGLFAGDPLDPRAR